MMFDVDTIHWNYVWVVVETETVIHINNVLFERII